MTPDRARFILSSTVFFTVAAALITTVVLDVIFHRFTFRFAGLYTLVVEFSLLFCLAVSGGAVRMYLERLRGY